MIVHRLDGCAPTPLAHYLKALGILRLIAEQLDPEVRGWWEGERFLLASRKDEHELLAFFLAQYQPTPLVAPWNKGSGFFYESDPGLLPIEKSRAGRFERLRAGIRAARAQLDAISDADGQVRQIKGEAKNKALTGVQREALKKSEDHRTRLADAERRFKQLKADLIPDLRLVWRGPQREWMDAALVLDDDGVVRFPALLGTGGNDGRLDFTNNFFQRLNELFDCDDPDGRPRSGCERWLREALFGQPSRALAPDLPVGQFAPGRAGGPNMSSGVDGSSRLNPADFVLMMEGTVLFASAATRRLESQTRSRASAPFALFGRAAGYASAADSDESARGEQWMPLWANPLGFPELRRLLAEGRAQLGARGAAEPLDLARAVARLGTARGLSAFQRFGYIERNGQSNLAVPLGRFVVPEHASPKLSCLDDLEAWLSRLRHHARATEGSHRLAQTERRLTDALFAVVQHPDEAERWQAVLLCLADVEAVQITGSGYEAGPIPPLDPEWVRAAYGADSAELRLALALALQASRFRIDGRPAEDAAVRRYWLSLDGNRFATTGTSGQRRLAQRPDRVMQGRRGVDDAIALVDRCLIEASQQGMRRLQLRAAASAAASSRDLARVTAGGVDLDRTLRLARALMAINPRKWAQSPVPCAPTSVNDMPDDAWAAIRLTMLAFPIRHDQWIGTDPAILRRLESGDAAGAVDRALARLRAVGIRPTIRIATVSPNTARLWAAALAFPIAHSTARAFVWRLDPNYLRENIA